MQAIKLGFFIALTAVVLVLAFPACSADRESQGGEETLFGERYAIPMSLDAYSTQLQDWVVDRDGATIPEDRQFDVLHDVLTGEPQCQVLRKTIEKSRNRDDGAIITAESAALFDLEGNMIYDWGECSYLPGFGDFVVRQETRPQKDDETRPLPDGESGLLDFRAKELHMEDVGYVERLSDDEALLLHADSRPMGVMGRAGEKLSGFPVDDLYEEAWAWNGYIRAITHSWSPSSADGQSQLKHFLLTRDFEQILAYDYLEESFAGRALAYTEKDWVIDSHGVLFSPNESRGVITPEGKELYRIPERLYHREVEYFDEDFIVINRFDGSARSSILSLRDWQVIVDGIEAFSFEPWYSAEPPGNLLAYVHKDRLLYSINRDGSIAESKRVPEATNIEVYANGFFRVRVEAEEGKETGMLLDMDLNEVIPAGAYDEIGQAFYWENNRYRAIPFPGVFVCTRHVGQDKDPMSDLAGLADLVDLVDSQGRVLAEGVNEIYSVGPDRIAVRKGFDVGLMDWHGNWIAKRSLFSELQED